MTLHLDDEVRFWVYGVANLNAGSFLRAIAKAAIQADSMNYAILRPALLQFKLKYPHYHAKEY